VIQGSGDECYRPRHIFGSPNNYRYQRLFGELHLTGFEVSHTKDGFRWDENEQTFLELLREHLDHENLPLIRQAEGYRIRKPKARVKVVATKAVDEVARIIEKHVPDVLPGLASATPVETPATEIVSPSVVANRTFDIRFRDVRWIISVQITSDPAESQWLVLSDTPSSPSSPRRLAIKVSIAHPFMVRFAQDDVENVECLLRVAAAVALAEICARDAGVSKAGTIRRNVNDILRDALSHA